MKRMIDNKDYEALKNDVNDLKVEIENLEVPSITITIEQMTSATTAQLTDEQYDILDNNINIYVTVPQGFSIMIYKLGSEEHNIWFTSNANLSNDNVLEVNNFVISVNKTTKVVTIVEAKNVVANPTLEGTESDLEGIEIDGTKYKVGGGKQLYQHNISIYFNNTDTGSRTFLNLTLILDNNTALDTTEKVANKLWDLGYDLYNDKGMIATGFHFIGGTYNKTYSIIRVGAYNNYPYHKRVRFQYFDSSLTTLQTVGYNDLLPTEGSVTDTIVSL